MVSVEYLYMLLFAVLLFEFLSRDINGQVLVLVGVGLFPFAALGEQVFGKDLAEIVSNFAYFIIAAGVLVLLINEGLLVYRRVVGRREGHDVGGDCERDP